MYLIGRGARMTASTEKLYEYDLVTDILAEMVLTYMTENESKNKENEK